MSEYQNINEYAYDGFKWDLEKMLMLSIECESYIITTDKIGDICCCAYLLKLNDKYYVLETVIDKDDNQKFFNAPYETDKEHIIDVEYKYLPRQNKHTLKEERNE